VGVALGWQTRGVGGGEVCGGSSGMLGLHGLCSLAGNWGWQLGLVTGAGDWGWRLAMLWGDAV